MISMSLQYRCACLVIALAIAGVLFSIAMLGTGIAAPRNPTFAGFMLAQNGAPGTDPASSDATAKPAANSTAKSGPPAPRNLEPLPPGRYTGILGKKVAGPDGKDLGLIVDVIVDVNGKPRAAVIDFGGFLGVGSRKIAVDWRLLNFAPDRADGQIWLSLDRAEIQAAPEYRQDAVSNEMVGPPWEVPHSPVAGK
jgi:PRC-barrel domain